MDFVCHRGITLILIGRSAIQLICVYDVYLGVRLKEVFKLLNPYGANNVVQFSCTIKTKVFAEEANS